MQAIQEFFWMGGYAFYVWTSYGLALIVLGINFIAPLRCEQQLWRELARKARRQYGETKL